MVLAVYYTASDNLQEIKWIMKLNEVHKMYDEIWIVVLIVKSLKQTVWYIISSFGQYLDGSAVSDVMTTWLDGAWCSLFDMYGYMTEIWKLQTNLQDVNNTGSEVLPVSLFCFS